MLLTIKSRMRASWAMGFLTVLALLGGTLLLIGGLHSQSDEINGRWMPAIRRLEQLQTQAADLQGGQTSEPQRAAIGRDMASNIEGVARMLGPDPLSDEARAIGARWSAQGSDPGNVERLRRDLSALAEQAQRREESVAAQGDALFRRAQIIAAAAGLAMALGVLIGALFFERLVVTPLHSLSRTMRRLADSDFDVDIAEAGRRDEIGDMAKSVEVFKANGVERGKLEARASQFQSDLDRRLRETEAAFESAGQAQKALVEQLAARLLKLADGDLSVRLTDAVAAEYGQLKSDFNSAVAQLEAAIGAVVQTTRGIRSGADEIAQASDDIARRSEQQAASLEQTAAALEQIAATVRRTADGAEQATQVVTAARRDAEGSGAVVGQAVAAMNEIERSSSQITQIIGVIDEIAFQTNLLALNAGVEAARAGDAGRGFAVVAAEVRALAQRSAEAAKEIKALISTSSQQVGQGVALVGETGEALHRIVEQVAEIHALVSDISRSAHEQAVGLAQVSSAVTQMDRVVQQNAGVVQESTAATHALNSEAAELAGLVSRFKTGPQPDANPAPAAQDRLAAPISFQRRGAA